VRVINRPAPASVGPAQGEVMKTWIMLGCILLSGCGSSTFLDDRHMMMEVDGRSKADLIQEAAEQGRKRGFSEFQIISVQDPSMGKNIYVAFYNDDTRRYGPELYKVADTPRR
jgi:hypothetical protein